MEIIFSITFRLSIILLIVELINSQRLIHKHCQLICREINREIQINILEKPVGI